MGRIATGIVVLLGMALAAVWLVPPMLDWDRYRADVAALATAALGQPVRIEGAIALRLLPQPTLEAGRVAVEAGPGASLTARRLRLGVALFPLLAGRVDARELVLQQAEIRLPWPLEPGALALRSPGWLSSLSARLEDGRLVLGDVSVTGINATLATGEISGSFFSAGRAKAGGRDWMFTVRVSRPGGDGAVGLDVTLDGQGPAQGLGAVVSGQVQADGTMLGRLSARGPDLSLVVPAPPVPFRAEGRLSFGAGLLAADELVGEVAGSPVQGAVALRLLPALRLDVALAASRMDLDAWGAAVLAAARGGALGRIPVGVDLSAEAGALAGGVVRGVRAAFDLAGNRLTVREARAILPGDAALALEGAVVPDAAGALRFEGKARLAAPALRNTLDWSLAALDGTHWAAALPPGVLRSAEVEAAVQVGPGVVTLTGITGRVDGAALAANLALHPGAQPALRALLALERLDLDAWFPGDWPGMAGLAAALPAISADIQLEAKAASWRGVAIAPLALDLAKEPGRLVLRRLDAKGEGMALAASGTVLEGGRVADARLDLRADRADTVLPALPVPASAGPAAAAVAARLGTLAQAPLSLQLQAGGAPESLGLKLLAELGDLRIEATPTLNLPAARWAGSVALRHPGAPRLAVALGLEAPEPWLGAGSFALEAALEGQGGSVAAESFNLAAGTLRAQGALRWQAGPVPRLTGQVKADSLPLPPLHLREGEPLAAAALRGWAAEVQVKAREVLVDQQTVLGAVTASVALSAGVLRVDIAEARLGGGPASGQFRLDAAARPPVVRVEGRVAGAAIEGSLFGTPIDLAGGRVDAELRLDATGYAAAGLLASLGGQVRLTARDGTLAGVELGRIGPGLDEADLRLALAGGRTPFATLAATARVERGGLVLEQAEARGPAGGLSLTGTVDLARGLLALRLGLVPAVADPPELGLRLTGPLGEVERVPELAEAVRWRAAHPR
jgi:uncharacterized protein involved in outer membrane biogenesis